MTNPIGSLPILSPTPPVFAAVSGSNDLQAPWMTALQESAVPIGTALKGYEQGIHGPAIGWRFGGLDDATPFSVAVGTISNPDVAVDSALELVGQREHSSQITPIASPALAAALLGVSFALIARSYGKTSLVPGRIPFSSAVKWTGFWFSFYAAMNMIESSLPAIAREGLVLGALTFNAAYYVAHQTVWGLLSELWSIIAFLPFLLSGPFFKGIFMRGQTELDDFIVSGDRYHKAEAATLQELVKEGKGRIRFQVSAERLLSHEVRSQIRDLPAGARAFYENACKYPTLRKRHADLKRLQEQGLRVSIRSVSQENVRDAAVRAAAKTSVTLLSDSRIKRTAETEDFISRGIAVPSGKDPSVLILAKSYPLRNGDVIPVVQGIVQTKRPHSLDDPKEWQSAKSGEFKVSVAGPAAEAVTATSGVFGKGKGIPLLERLWRKKIKPTVGEILLKLPPKGVENERETSAVLRVAGSRQYAGRLVRPPTVPISKAVLEKIGKKDVVLELPEEIYQAFLKENFPAVVIEAKGKRGGRVAILSVKAPFLLDVLEGDEQLGSMPDVDFLKAVADKKLLLRLANPLSPVSSLFQLKPVEKASVQVEPGSLRSLWDVEHPADDPGHRGEFLKVLGRTARQAFEGGRGRALGAFSFVGATFFSAPTNIVMDALYGYLSPQTWLLDSLKSYFTRALNMLGAPAIVNTLKKGKFGYSAFHYYVPGMIYMGLIHTPVMVIAHGEPDAMLAKNEIVALSMETEPEARERHLREFLARERVVVDGQREDLIEKRLAHRLPTGYVRRGDMEKIDHLYTDKYRDNPGAQVRLLEGLEGDFAFMTMMENLHPDRFRFYEGEIARRRKIFG